jgi:hypothetical protein
MMVIIGYRGAESETSGDVTMELEQRDAVQDVIVAIGFWLLVVLFLSCSFG